MTTGVLNHKITRRGFLKTSAALGAVAALGDRLFGGPLSTLMVGAQIEGVVSDKWVASTCHLCRGGRDLIRGHVVNGVLVTVEGNKEHEGKLPSPALCCVKPRGLVQWAYNPYRLKGPMKRTNPMKGLNEDPGFVEISWDEALDTMADKLKEIQAMGLKNEHGWPRVIQGGMGPGGKTVIAWNPFWQTFGSTETISGLSNCYGTEHYFGINWLYEYATSPDYGYASWLLDICKNMVGATTMGYASSGMKELADFRVRSGKLIYVSPFSGHTGAKADEWIPIKHATDSALLYAMTNVILNEMDWRQVADTDFIKKVSSSPYLVGPNGYWARDPATKKPLVWDSVAGTAKVEDDPTIGDFALDGGPYTINAVEVDFNEEETAVTQGTPSFQLVIDHFRDYTPEWAAPITDIPAKTIRRIAHEFVENSMVGSTIKIDGYTYRYRPASISIGKHTSCGVGAEAIVWAQGLLLMLMGSMHAPGGMACPGLVHASQEHSWTKDERTDGFRPRNNRYGGNFSWPPSNRKMQNVLALGTYSGSVKETIQSGEAVHDFPGSVPDVYVTLGRNLISGNYGGALKRRGYEKIPFFANFGIEINESNWYADLVLPDALWIIEEWAPSTPSASMDHYTSKNNFYGLKQPMIESPVNTRDSTDIFTDLAAKMGPEFLADYNGRLLDSDADPTRKYTAEEVMDHEVRTASSIPAEMRGQYGLDYFKEHGALFFPVSKLSLNFYRVQEQTGTRYDLPYQEGWKGSSLKRLEDLHGVGIDWYDEQLDVLTYGLLPYKDTRALFEEVYEAGGEYDLFHAHHRVHTFGFGRNKDMPWNIEVTDPESKGIVINPETAAKKGLVNGDWVALETRSGGRTTGRLIVSPTIRPDAVETADFGHYQTPISRTQGLPSSAEMESWDPRLGGAACGWGRCSPSIVKIYKTEEIIPNKPAV